MSCPDIGHWRAWMDGEAGEDAPALASHLAACADCRPVVGELRQNAALAATAIGRIAVRVTPSDGSVERSLTRLVAARVELSDLYPSPQPSPLSRSLVPLRMAVGGLAAALMLVAVLGTPQGRGAAAQFLAGFRGERFAPVPLNAGQLQNIEQTLTQLENLGTLRGLDSAPEPRTVASVEEAARLAGFPVKQPDPATLPAGVGGAPSAIRVVPAGEVRFTFDRDKARAYYRSIGRPEVSLPERFHGASLVVQTPPGVLLEYRAANAAADRPLQPEKSTAKPPAGGAGGNQVSGSQMLPGGFGLLIGQAGVLTVGVEGAVSLEELRDFLLSLPGLSPETVRQLRAIDDWRSTLPLPIPMDQINWQRATLAGNPGLILNDNTGLGSAAIWQQDGRIYGIAGAARARDIQRVADSLR